MRGEIVITKDAKSDALFLHDARKWQVLEMQILSTKYLRFDSNGLLTLKKKIPPEGSGWDMELKSLEWQLICYY